MSEAIVIDNTGCVVEVFYSYHPITQAEIDGYKINNMPQPDGIYQTWDARNRALLAASSNNVDFVRITIQDDGSGNPVTSYNIPALEDIIKVLSVEVEGIGMLESSVVINTETGDISIPGAQVGQFIKITYKK